MARNLTGSSNDDTLQGGAGGDTLKGFGGDDVLIGGAGSDTLYGGNGDDLLNGGTGVDAMIGGAGSDTYIVDDLAEVNKIGELAADPGVDLVKSSVSLILAIPDAIENLTLTGTAVYGTGNMNDNRVTGNAGANILTGGYGADTVIGGDGNDTIYASSISDTLIGGGGSDTFTFDSHSSPPVIQGFQPGVDHLSFGTPYSFPALGLGFSDVAFYAADGAHAAHDSDDRIIYDTHSGKLYYDADGMGGSPAALVARLAGAPELTASDISTYIEHRAHPL